MVRHDDEITGTYTINATDIPSSHKQGTWIYDKKDKSIYLDQFHKYQNKIYESIENKLSTRR